MQTNPRTPSVLTAEDQFFAWLLGLGDPCDMAEAARLEIARLDRDQAHDGESLRLKAFLLQAAAFQPHSPRGRRRHLH